MLKQRIGEYGPDSGGRVKGVTVIKPIVFGNQARYFGKKREEDGHTHSWTVYVKPYLNDDMSVYVKKVHFRLHDSYTNQVRVVLKPPYEVTETGWGEFEVQIKIYFHDPNERPVTIYHILKLFQTDPNVLTGKKPVISEQYDEMIFQDPSQMMHQLLTNSRSITSSPDEPWLHDTDFEEKKEKTLALVLAAKKKIREEIGELQDKLRTSKDTAARLKAELAKGVAGRGGESADSLSMEDLG